MQSYKICKDCGQKLLVTDKNFSSYISKVNNKRYYRSSCKKCSNEKQKKYSLENKSSEKAYNKEYYQKSVQWVEDNKELFSNMGKPWTMKDLNYVLEYYHKTDLKSLAIALGRTPSAIKLAYNKHKTN